MGSTFTSLGNVSGINLSQDSKRFSGPSTSIPKIKVYRHVINGNGPTSSIQNFSYVLRSSD